jgi:isochorismate hydrolase
LQPYLSASRTKTFRLDPMRSALLVIDMQEFFLDPGSHAYLPAANAIVGNVRKLLSAYRMKRLPVFFTYHAYAPGEDPGIMASWWGDVVVDGTPLARVIRQLNPLENEPVLRKTKYSALAGTGLEDELKRLGTGQLVITGILTHLCCETTARAAFMRGFEVYFVIDGTATQNEELHVGSLRALADGFAMPVTTREVLKCLKGDTK